MERIDEAVASVETMDIMTSILLEVNPTMNPNVDNMDIVDIMHVYYGCRAVHSSKGETNGYGYQEHGYQE